MSELLSDDFESGNSLAASGYTDVFNCAVESDPALDGAFCVRSSLGQTGPFITPTLSPATNQFHCSAILDHSRTPAADGSVGGSALFQLEAIEPNFGRHTLCALFHFSTSSTNRDLVVVDSSGGKDEFGNTFVGSPLSSPPSVNGLLTSDLTITNAYTLGDPVTITFEGQLSTITGGSTSSSFNGWNDGGSAASDGFLRVKVNGSTVWEETGLRIGFLVHASGAQGWVPTLWSQVLLTCQGRLDNLCIRDDIGIECFTPTTVPADIDGDPSIPCCKTIRNAEETPGTDLGVDPVGELPPWDATCEGGGQVDGVPDLIDGESWL